MHLVRTTRRHMRARVISWKAATFITLAAFGFTLAMIWLA